MLRVTDNPVQSVMLTCDPNFQPPQHRSGRFQTPGVCGITILIMNYSLLSTFIVFNRFSLHVSNESTVYDLSLAPEWQWLTTPSSDWTQPHKNAVRQGDFYQGSNAIRIKGKSTLLASGPRKRLWPRWSLMSWTPGMSKWEPEYPMMTSAPHNCVWSRCSLVPRTRQRRTRSGSTRLEVSRFSRVKLYADWEGDLRLD